MLTMDVFRQDAFSAISLTAAVDKVGYVPGLLDGMPGLFDPVPVRTPQVWVEIRGTDAALIQTTPRGAPLTRIGSETRDALPFKTFRLAEGDRIMADELSGMRAFGSETELQTLQADVARRQLRIRRNFSLTRENLKLGCVQGIVLDADGSTIVNWSTALGQAIPAEIDFDLDNANPASGAVRKKCSEVVRSVLRGLKGLGGNSVQVIALCGDNFWDDLTAHPEVRQTYLNTMEAAQLRQGNTFEMFSYGGITWINYRSTDDGGATPTVGIPTDKAKFFPMGAGIFKWAMAPAERFEFVNTFGQDVYSWMVLDRDRDMWADVEVYSYPLPVCTMPQALHRARRT